MKGGAHALVGNQAPDFSVPAAPGGGTLSLSAFAGKAVILDFWATWCAPCKVSFPYYEALTKKYPADLVVLGVSVDEEPDGIEAFVRETAVTFPIGWDKDQEVAKRYEPKSMPTSFLIDRNGIVRFMHGGFREGDGERLDAMVSEILK